ncbi:MerR family transcriptional regulator [Pediococcus argentinicus]|uniref:HTH merR-type domain-containing protein n=1 Tax=Pediococcus argentinicus TaxID=480391 RepID=A0A0R2NI08_9LACO|nr:MerR family transcriptional regulator [Pediococcus argentinicus]KRO25439.1 hypothetical protein IV88_GL000170 [Pediococcus argentinicus]NKZ22229.1 MerR family transcriptional regulator [Pediococcus argentinicus]GEP19302.1 MerR family transcriptional regulator [Pediococcus argentinicus]
MKNELTAGAFAKLCGTTKATLRWYRKVGLLIPKAIGDNGYAYYGTEQLIQFSTIQALQKVGYTLNQIKSYSDFDNADNSFLEKQISQLDQEISILQTQRDYLKNLLNTQKSLSKRWKADSKNGDSKVIHYEKTFYLMIPTSADNPAYYQKQLFEFKELLSELDLPSDSTIITFLDENHLEKKVFSNGFWVGIQIKDDKLTPILKESKNTIAKRARIFTRPAGNYFTYLTSFALETTPEQSNKSVNPMVQGQIMALRAARRKKAILSAGLLETPVTIKEQEKGIKYLFMEISILIK